MKKKTIIDLIVWLCIVIAITFFVNAKTNNSLASIYEIFNVCDVKNIDNCSEEELQDLITKELY